MAIETLKDVTEIGGYKVEHGPVDEQANWPTDDTPVYIDHQQDLIIFKIQNGSVKENGVNGCQLDTLLHVVYKMLKGLDKKVPCFENGQTLAYIEHALDAQKRRKDRIKDDAEKLRKKQLAAEVKAKEIKVPDKGE